MNMKNRLARLECREDQILDETMRRLTDAELEALIAAIDAQDEKAAGYQRYLEVRAVVESETK